MKEPRKTNRRFFRPKGHPRHTFNRMSGRTMSRMVPNAVTFSALCLGLTSIHFGFRQEWDHAVACIFIAAFFDGIDGRIARFLRADSEIGASLDSLCDFINFGVAPSFVIYFYALHLWGNQGWSLCLLFSACMAWRLARFNASHYYSKVFSVGVPAPAGALMALLPIVFHLVWGHTVPLWGTASSVFVTALLLASRYPTFVFKDVTIPPGYRGLVRLMAVFTIVSLMSMPWATLLGMGIAYVLSLPVSGYYFYKKGYR
jgi:CDP-diacylglycerol--serine O-phosphatidyltransferase